MKLTNESKIGILVVAVFVLLAYFTIRAGDFNLSRGGYNIKAQFNDIDGVNLNSPVMFNGYEVGMVEDIRIIDVDNKVKMELLIWINGDVKIRQGAKAYVKNLGFMGEKYVGLKSSETQGEVLPANSVILGEEPPSFEGLVSKGHTIANDVAGIASNLNERLEINKQNIDTFLAELSELTANLSSLSKSIDERITTNEENIDQIIQNINFTSVNIKEMTHDLKLHPWKLLHKSER